MARVPVESQVRAEALQTIAAPKIQAVTARLDPRADSAFQLAESLGAAGPAIQNLNERVIEQQRQDAISYASSMTADELRKKIDNGELPAWKSPLWVATVQHTSGDNQARAVFREAESKVANGEFKTQEELDQFITNRRNDALQGKSSYELAGFDRHYQDLKGRVQSQMNAVMTKRYETEGVTIANEAINNRLYEVTTPAWNGKTNQERIDYILQEYDKHRTARTINDDTARTVLDTAVMKLAASGQKDLVNEFLNTKLPNNGPSIETFLDVRNGNSTGRTLQIRNTAETNWNRVARENEERTVAAQQEVIINAAGNQADELVSQRNGGAMPDVTLPMVGGGTKVVKGADIVKQSVERFVANNNLPFDEQVRLYKNNGVMNDGWKKEMNTAVYNLGEISIDADGKAKGELLDGTKTALEKFAVMRQVSEQYAKDIVGEDNYKILNKVQALREVGVPDTAQAAAIVNQINRHHYEPKAWGNIQKDVSSAIEDVKNPGIFTGRFWGELFRGEFGNGDKNIIPIESHMRELAESFVAARIAPDSKTAVKLATDYMSKSVVQINNTMYMRTDLPKVPQGEDETAWFKNYLDKALIPKLSKMGIEPNRSDLTLIPQKGGQEMYMVANKALPMASDKGTLMYVTKAEIEEWVKGQINIRDEAAANKADNVLTIKQNSRGPNVIDAPSGAAVVSPNGVRKRSN
jgi:hypothetical protein